MEPGSGTPGADPFDLDRFVRAQDGGTWEAALAELERGRKTTHWMWFVFPQIAGLGRSPMAQRYAISSLEEAEAYLRHPVLGPRLVLAATTVAVAPGTAEEILGGIDAVKLRSSMTLFTRIGGTGEVFGRVLDRHFGGEHDPATLERI